MTCDDIKSIKGKCKSKKAGNLLIIKLKTNQRMDIKEDLTLSINAPDEQRTDIDAAFKRNKAKWKHKSSKSGNFEFQLENPRCPSFNDTVFYE